MNIIIYGATELGCLIATEFFEEDRKSIIDKEENFTNNFSKLDIGFVVGDAPNVDILKQAGLKDADLFLACSDSDEVNIVACLTAKRMSGLRTVCFVGKKEYKTSLGLTKDSDFISDLYIDDIIWPEELLTQDIFRIITVSEALDVENFAKGTDDELREKILADLEAKMAEKNKNVPTDIMRMIEKSILLQVLDQLWKDHIATLDLMRHTIVLRAYGQKDPLNEYKKEAFKMFSDLLDALKEQTTVVICRTKIQQESAEQIQRREQRVQNQNMSAVHEEPKSAISNGVQGSAENVLRHNPKNKEFSPQNPSTWGKIARNDPCPCGSGKKYKNCCGRDK